MVSVVAGWEHELFGYSSKQYTGIIMLTGNTVQQKIRLQDLVFLGPVQVLDELVYSLVFSEDSQSSIAEYAEFVSL